MMQDSPPPAAPTAEWRSSPLGHSFRKFEAEYNQHPGHRSRASEFGVDVGENGGPGGGTGGDTGKGAKGANARVIWFIERCRLLEKRTLDLEAQLAAKTRGERRHQGDVSDLRALINDLCNKVRKVERERDVEKSKATALEVEAVQVRARLGTALQDTKKYRSNDARLHTMLVDSNRELQEEKLKVEELEDALDGERARAETAEADAVVQVEAVEARMAESVGRANQRAADLLEELKGIQNGWHEMKQRADASQDREHSALRQTEARIAIAEGAAKAAQTKARDAVLAQSCAAKEAGVLARRVETLEGQLTGRIGELENLRSSNSKLQAEKVLFNQQILELRCALRDKQQALRDGHRQTRVRHIKFIDARLSAKRELEMKQKKVEKAAARGKGESEAKAGRKPKRQSLASRARRAKVAK